MSRPMGHCLGVIIVNYCTGPLVAECLRSLDVERRNVPSLRVVVVDNDSPDGSAEVIADAIVANGWHWVTLLRSASNGGFGAGNNLGIEHLLSQPGVPADIWMLNPDTVVSPGAAAEIVRFMRAVPKAGIAGTAIREADGQLWPYAFRFPTILGEIERGCQWRPVSRLLSKRATLRRMGSASEPVEWVSGASFVVRRELIEAGLRFDEGYFLYYEEIDFCRTARDMGWECWYLPEAVITHIAGQSTGVTGKDANQRRVPEYWFASRQRYFVKNHGRLYGFAADLAWVLAHLFFRAKQAVRRASLSEPPHLLRDFLRRSWRLVPGRT